jgi:hypothetical protein
MVALFVVALALAFQITGNEYILIFLAYGFAARTLTGPSLSPIGQLVTRVLIPLLRIPNKPVAGPPKRFAQSIGLGFSIAALVTFYLGDSVVITRYLIGTLGLFASIEAFLGFCTGCYVFGWLMRFGIIPDSVCEDCKIDYPGAQTDTGKV